jgi:uncharacterized membrane protein
MNKFKSIKTNLTLIWQTWSKSFQPEAHFWIRAGLFYGVQLIMQVIGLLIMHPYFDQLNQFNRFTHIS